MAALKGRDARSEVEVLRGILETDTRSRAMGGSRLCMLTIVLWRSAQMNVHSYATIS